MENKNEKSFDLNTHTARLLMSEPFFASLSRRVTKRASTAIPTAGVRVNPDTARFEMLYNPEFFATLSDKEKTAVLIHEFYHLVFDHVTDRRPEGVNPKLWNIAADLAINCHISDLPSNACVPGVGPFADFASGLTAEAYFKLIEKKKEDESNKESGDGETSDEEGMPEDSFDSHEDWGKGEGNANEIAKERIKEYVKEASQEAQKSSNGWGSVSASCRKEILERLSTRIDWKKVLRYFVKTSARASKRSTVKSVNKRYRYIHPGKKVSRQAQIAISIDQSGSVSDQMLAAFFAELSKLAKLATFTVVPFDTEVYEEKVYTWKKGETKKWERVLAGGTCFDAPTTYVNKHGFDGHIVLTDMMAPKPKASKCQRMWMTTEYYARRPWFKTNERVIAISGG
mgnify:CR=1 FL=1